MKREVVTKKVRERERGNHIESEREVVTKKVRERERKSQRK